MPSSPLACPAAVLVAAAIFVPSLMPAASAADAPPYANLSFVERYAIPPEVENGPSTNGPSTNGPSTNGPSTMVTAIGVRAGKKDDLNEAASTPQPLRAVVLFDTSATQVGEHRRRAFEALDGLLAAVRPDDRLLLAAVDVAVTPLHEGFLAADSDDVAAARRTLASRVPLGSTDLVAALAAAADLFAGELGTAPGQHAVIYLGDGPGLAATDTAEFAAMVDLLRERQVAASGLGVGPRVNWPFLASVANATGGVVLTPTPDEESRDAGGRLAELAAEPVIWIESASLRTHDPKAAWRMLPARMPPLRSDRDAVVLAVSPDTIAAISLTAPRHAGPGEAPP